MGPKPRREPPRGRAPGRRGAPTSLAPLSPSSPPRIRHRLHFDLPGDRDPDGLMPCTDATRLRQIRVRLSATLALTALTAIGFTACGSGGESSVSVDPPGVAACLKDSEFVVTQVPKVQIKPAGAGQTGELLVAKRQKPTTANDADAVVAFWTSSADAQKQVKAVKKTNGSIEGSGEVTVQPTSKISSTGELKEIEACAL